MFEPQDHPDDIPYPGAPPTPPYDSAGWTLAFQMGVKFDRILERLDGPFERIEDVELPMGRVLSDPTVSAGRVLSDPTGPTGYLVSHHQNDAFIAANRLLAAGGEVFWPLDRAANAMYIAARPSTLPVLQQAAADLGLTFTGVAAPPEGEAWRVRPVRVGLWDRHGGAPSSGWIRWLLERYEFPFAMVDADSLDAGNLAAGFDAIVLADDAVPGRGARMVPRLRQFIEAGGTVIAMGRATAIGEALGVVSNALVEPAGDGTMRPLPREKYYVPGSVLRASVDNTTPLGYGFEPEVDVFFDRSPVFRLSASGPRDTPAAVDVPRRVAWFDGTAPLRSGWAWGQHHLEGGVAVADVPIGRGRLLLFGPEVTFRAQSHGTFKFLFNGILFSRAELAHAH
jgi:hypothetical protein